VNLVDRFNDYFSKIEEALSSPQDISWNFSDESSVGFFDINGVKYRIEYLKQIGNNYSYSFSIFKGGNWIYDISEDGNVFKVLSTIIHALELLFNKTGPDSIIFSAIDDNVTRKRIYERYCKDFCQKYNYKLSNRGNEKFVMFVMFDNTLLDDRKEDIFQSVKKVIEIGK